MFFKFPFVIKKCFTQAIFKIISIRETVKNYLVVNVLLLWNNHESTRIKKQKQKKTILPNNSIKKKNNPKYFNVVCG